MNCLSEYEILLEKLLELKPEFSKEDIEEQIKQKKEKIGAGYLTDQGAIFLIASDLGINLAEPLKVEMSLKDLYVGAKEVSLETRVLNMSPAKQFSRKDGTPFFLRNMTVYDNNTTASVKLWDEKAKLSNLDGLKPGDLVKIIKAYVKSDLNGSPTINVGSGSNIESISTESEIPSIDSITVNVSAVKEDQKDLVVAGNVDGVIDSMQFTNSRGLPGKALRLRLKGEDGNSKRVILWGQDESTLPKMIIPGAQAILYGVKTKMGNQGLEIHGNESTIIKIEGKAEAEPLTIRILSKSKNDAGNSMILGIDKNKKMFKIIDSSTSTEVFNANDIVECMPTKAYGNSITIDNDSFVRKLEDDQSIASLSELRTKISDIKIGDDYYVEAIILKIPGIREIQTKTGETVALSEMFVEDDSGQIWIKGWRNQARLLEKCSIGEIVSISGVTAKKGLEDRTELVLTQFSSISKKN